MFGGSCSLKGGYIKVKKTKRVKKTKVFKKTKGFKNIKKKGGGYGSSSGSLIGSYIKPFKSI